MSDEISSKAALAVLSEMRRILAMFENELYTDDMSEKDVCAAAWNHLATVLDDRALPGPVRSDRTAELYTSAVAARKKLTPGGHSV